MEKENGQNVKNAMCYIPMVACVLYFTEEKKSSQFLRHIRYGIILYVTFIILLIFLRSVFMGIMFLSYVGISAYLGYKAYIGEEVKFKFIDDLFKNDKNTKDNDDDFGGLDKLDKEELDNNDNK